MSHCLTSFSHPKLPLLHVGKVRDSFRIDAKRRLIVVSDRLSAFDFVLQTPIPHKGAVLNGISNWWFERTSDIIANHFLHSPDPNVAIVREAVPIRIEMVVRGYLCGSVLREYEQGKRVFSGITLPDGLMRHQRFDAPILTPTTKEKSDRPISPADIALEGWASHDLYEQMSHIALRLYEFGCQELAKKGLLLVDTKYEFGLINDELVLIDEIHTPDSSRFWLQSDYDAEPTTASQIDKEYMRQWLISNKINGEYPTSLPDEVAQEGARRYLQIYETLTGKALRQDDDLPIQERIIRNLHIAGVL